MKLAFSTLACPSWSLERVFDVAGREGYHGVELRFLENDDALWMHPEFSGSGLTTTRRRLRDTGLGVPCVDARSFFHDPDAKLRRRSLDEAERVVNLAHELGAQGVRVYGDQVQPGSTREATRHWIAECLDCLAERAYPAGVEVWLETHGDFARARDVLSLLELVHGDTVGILWDAPNAFDAGEDPADGAQQLAHRIRHVHLKDLWRRPGAHSRPALPGEGEFPAAAALFALTRIGYSGWLAFEWEKRWHPEIPPAEEALPRFVGWITALLGGMDVLSAGPRAPRQGRPAAEAHPPRLGPARAAVDVEGTEQ